MKNIQIIAEIASSHGGDLNKILTLIDLCADLNADYTKLQIFRANELVSEENQSIKELQKIEFSKENWLKIFQHCEDNNYKIIAELYDEKSYNIIKKFDCVKGIKIPAAELTNIDFIEKIAINYELIFLSIGGALENEVDNAINKIKRVNNNVNIILVHGFQNFPTSTSDAKLGVISKIIKNYNTLICFADHTDSNDKFFSIAMPMLANVSGAKYIEKHITLSKKVVPYDAASSLNVDEFYEFINLIKNIDLYFNSKIFDLSPAEIRYRNEMKRFAILSKQVKKGESLKMNMLIFKRTGVGGIEYDKIIKMIGIKFSRNVNKGEIIEESMFE